jgi:hypothetical protein
MAASLSSGSLLLPHSGGADDGSVGAGAGIIPAPACLTGQRLVAGDHSRREILAYRIDVELPRWCGQEGRV